MHDTNSSANLRDWLRDLACPVCYAALEFSADAVLCTKCRRKYPVEDGIPVLIAERSEVKPL